jgi:hypothetical protein
MYTEDIQAHFTSVTKKFIDINNLDENIFSILT